MRVQIKITLDNEHVLHTVPPVVCASGHAQCVCDHMHNACLIICTTATACHTLWCFHNYDLHSAKTFG